MRRVNAVYHRLMSAAFDPGSVRFVNDNNHTHTDAMDDGYEICVWCATHQSTDTPHLDFVIYEAICEQACVSLDGGTRNPDVVASKLASASQRKAVETALGSHWHLYLPAAYALGDATLAEVSKWASQVPKTIVPSHTARQLGFAVAAEVVGLPPALSTNPAVVDAAEKCARIIESVVWPCVLTPATYTRTVPVRPKKKPTASQRPQPQQSRTTVIAPSSTALTVGAGTRAPRKGLGTAAPRRAATTQPLPSRTGQTSPAPATVAAQTAAAAQPADAAVAPAPAPAATIPPTLDITDIALPSDVGIGDDVQGYLDALAAMPPADALKELTSRGEVLKTVQSKMDHQAATLATHRANLALFDGKVSHIRSAYAALVNTLDT